MGRARIVIGGVLAIAVLLAAAAPSGAATIKKLPRGFLWGVSSSAFQSEGGKLDDNWQIYIQQHPNFDPYKKSVDFRHRFRGDIGLADKMGVNIYRIGINWARVEPRRGELDPKALRFYDKVVDAMLDKGIRPLLTLDHWDYPRWIYEQGSWANPNTTKRFLRFVKLVAKRYRRKVDYWLTFNEGFFYRLAETAYRPLDSAGATAMTTNLIAAHRGAYDLIHRYNADAKVSSNVAWLGGPRTYANDPFFQGVKDKLDYAGVDYYNPGYDPADLGYVIGGMAWLAQLDPFGLYAALRETQRELPGLPIVVTENGMATDNAQPKPDGYRRGQNLQDNVYWLQRARRAGVPVIGYLYWSLTDNYEFGNYRSRFGLYSVDVKNDPTLRRVPTDAVAAYRSVISKRGVGAGYKLVRAPAAADCQKVVEADRAPCLAAASR